MTTLLEKTVETGTLAWASGYGSKFSYKDKEGTKYTIPAAGKNGHDAELGGRLDGWAIRPTTRRRCGSDSDQTGQFTRRHAKRERSSPGPTWADYMREIHQGHPVKDFVRPNSGLHRRGSLRQVRTAPDAQLQRRIDHHDLSWTGTQPTGYCDIHDQGGRKAESLIGHHVARLFGHRRQRTETKS